MSNTTCSTTGVYIPKDNQVALGNMQTSLRRLRAFNLIQNQLEVEDEIAPQAD